MIGIDHILISEGVRPVNDSYSAAYFDCDKEAIDHLGLLGMFVPSYRLGNSHHHRCRPRYDRSLVGQRPNDSHFGTLIEQIPHCRYDVEPTTHSHFLASAILQCATIAYPLDDIRPHRSDIARPILR